MVEMVSRMIDNTKRRLSPGNKPGRLSTNMRRTLDVIAKKAENKAGIDAASEDQLIGTEKEVSDLVRRINRRRWFKPWWR